MNKINARQLRQRYDDSRELAVIDVREEGVYARDGHLLRVSNIPLSVLELRVRALVPRLATRIVVCDGGEGLAASVERDAADSPRQGSDLGRCGRLPRPEADQSH